MGNSDSETMKVEERARVERARLYDYNTKHMSRNEDKASISASS